MSDNQVVVSKGEELISVLVADSTRMGSQLLADALRRDPRFNVVHFCAASNDVLAAANTYKPHVVLVSANLDEETLKGFEISRKLRSLLPDVKTVMLLDSSKRDLVVGAFGAGARGVFCRAESIEALRKCIYSVHVGQIWANSGEMRFVLEAFAEATPPRLVDAKGAVLLSHREQDVVRCVTEGLTNREIAARLKLSEHTVKNYIFRIFDKLGVSTRVEMVLYAFSQRAQASAGPDAGAEANRAPASAVDRFTRAAEEGTISAQFALAEMHRSGQGVNKDPITAYSWYLIAEKLAAQAALKSRAARETLAIKLKREESTEAERRATEWLKQHAANQGSPADSEASALKDPANKRIGLSAVPGPASAARKKNGQATSEKMGGELVVSAGDRRPTPVLLAPRGRENN